MFLAWKSTSRHTIQAGLGEMLAEVFMHCLRKWLPAVAVLLVALPVCASTTHHRKSTASKTVTHEPVQAMAPERATQIQTALIQRGYLAGVPTGTWDAASVAAMQKLQADNGWQTKFTPDARALIKLGLAGGDSADEAAATVPAGTGFAQ
jgi:hypothetical protein